MTDKIDWTEIGRTAADNYDNMGDFIAALALSHTAVSPDEVKQMSVGFHERQDYINRKWNIEVPTYDTSIQDHLHALFLKVLEAVRISSELFK